MAKQKEGGHVAALKKGKTRAIQTIEKIGTPKDDPQLLDRENAFLLYASFSGDLTRTAVALHSDALTVLRVADEERWQTKLTAILELKKAGKPGEVERAINRTMNFVQAHRLRNLIERQIRELSEMSDEELRSWCMSEIVTTHKDGSVSVEKKLHTRPYADLASAMEKVHNLSYAALNDTNQERAVRSKQEADEKPTAMEIHSAIAKAMSEVAASKTPRALLFDAQLEQVQSLLPSPVDDIKKELGLPLTKDAQVSEVKTIEPSVPISTVVEPPATGAEPISTNVKIVGEGSRVSENRASASDALQTSGAQPGDTASQPPATSSPGPASAVP